MHLLVRFLSPAVITRAASECRARCLSHLCGALRAACLAGLVATAASAYGQDIIINDGSTQTVPTDIAAGAYAKLFLSNASRLNVNAPLTLGDLADVTDGSRLNVNNDVTLTSGIVVDGSILSLVSGTLGGALASIDLVNSGFVRGGGRYLAQRFSVVGSYANFLNGDSIIRDLAVLNGYMSLEANLVLSGSEVGQGLYVQGGSGVERTNGALITARSAWADEAEIVTVAGDDYTDAIMLVSAGGLILNTGSQSFRGIFVTGTAAVGGQPSTFQTNVPITVSGTFPGTDSSIVIDNGGLFTTVGSVVAASVRLSGSNSVLENFGTSLDLGAIEIDPGSTLSLGIFGGVDGQVSNFGLKVADDVRSQLLGLIGAGNILNDSGDGLPLTAIYNATSNATYVITVPEPATYAMALAGLACGGFSMWRRRKRA